MRRLDYFWLFFLGLGIAILIASFQPAPGYMDADYYYAGGLQLASGRGFSEPFIWNFLNNPTGVPVPSHTYWMPLASLMAMLGMVITGSGQFSSARLGFIGLTACLPLLTVALSYSLNPNRKMALLAGALALLSGFYMPFLTTTDTFSLQMVLGGLFFLTAYRMTHLRYSLYLGIIAGLMHLVRADGAIWLIIALLVVVVFHSPMSVSNISKIKTVVLRILFCLIGYMLIMTPWYIRNAQLFGQLFPPGNSRTLWLTGYDELYRYPVDLLTITHWWASGIRSILLDRFDALGKNIQTAFAVQGYIFLFPLIIFGAWRLRSNPLIKLSLLAYGSIFIIMTVFFPYAGARGGFFHSGSALQIIFWVLVPLGLESVIEVGSRRRGWNPIQASRVFGSGLIGLALLFTVLTTFPKLLGSTANPAWGESEIIYSRLEQQVVALGASIQDIVLVNNPPGYFIASGRSAIVIPYGDTDDLLTVARRYHASYLILEANHPPGLTDLFLYPSSQPGLEFILSNEAIQIYKINNQPVE